MSGVGPTSSLPPAARRRGRSGTAWREGNMLGEVTQVNFDVTLQQIDVPLAGSWRNGQTAGLETRTGTLQHQDIDDRFKLEVWNYIQARRNGDRSAHPPIFDLVVVIDDVGAPQATRWMLQECQLYTYSGGYSNEDDLITRQIPFSFVDDRPLDAFEYGGSGIVVTEH
jgi:hypothetical protein